MAQASLVLRMEATSAKLLEVLDRTERSLDDLGTSAERAGSRSRQGAADAESGWGRVREFFGGGSGGMLSGIRSVAAALGGAFAVREVVQFGKESLTAFMGAQDASHRLSVALARQGIASASALAGFQAYAAELQRTTRFEDDATVAAMAHAMQLGVGAHRMREFTGLAADVTAALRTQGDASSSLDATMGQMALALQGNARGLGMMIPELKDMVEAGASTEAIFAKLQQRFGGSAVADVETLSGSFTRLTNTMGDLKEEVGGALVRGFAAGMGSIGGAEASVANLRKAIEDSIPAIRQWAGTFSAVFGGAFKLVLKAGRDLIDVIERIAGARGHDIGAGIGLAGAEVRVQALIDGINKFGDAGAAEGKFAADAINRELEKVGVKTVDLSETWEASFRAATKANQKAMWEGGATVDSVGIANAAVQAKLNRALEFEIRMRNQIAGKVAGAGAALPDKPGGGLGLSEEEIAEAAAREAALTALRKQSDDHAHAKEKAAKASKEEVGISKEEAAAQREIANEVERLVKLEEQRTKVLDDVSAVLLTTRNLETGSLAEQGALLESTASAAESARSAITKALDDGAISAQEAESEIRNVEAALQAISAQGEKLLGERIRVGVDLVMGDGAGLDSTEKDAALEGMQGEIEGAQQSLLQQLLSGSIDMGAFNERKDELLAGAAEIQAAQDALRLASQGEEGAEAENVFGFVLTEEQMEIWREQQAELAEGTSSLTEVMQALADAQFRIGSETESNIKRHAQQALGVAILKAGYQGLRDAMARTATEAFRMAIAGELSAKKLKQAAMQALAEIAQQEALRWFAVGLGKAAQYDWSGAALAFGAAAAWGLVANHAGKAASKGSAGGGGGAGGGGASGEESAGTSSAAAATEAARPARNVIVNVYGSMVGTTEEQLARHVHEFDQETEAESGGRHSTRRRR